jgi:hypothetical protein
MHREYPYCIVLKGLLSNLNTPAEFSALVLGIMVFNDPMNLFRLAYALLIVPGIEGIRMSY